MIFYQMDTEEVSDRFVAPCFVNGLEAYDGEINLGVEENMISNEYAVKLCLKHEVKRGNKVVKKEHIVALRGEIYFVKFIINPDKDDVEPGVIFGRSFLHMTKAITDFGAGTVTIYPDIDPFLEETEEEEKSNEDLDHLLDFNIDDIPLLGEEGLSPFVCKMGKSGRNKKRAVENLNFFYQDIGTSSSADGHLTQEEAAKEALAIRMSRKFALLEEERPIIETMAYHDKYKKILDEVWKDKVELDGKIIKEEEEAVKRIKGEALKEKDDPGAFIFPIRLEGQVNKNALADTGSDINIMPYRIYEQLGREDMKKVDRGITMINHTQAEAMGILTNVLCQVGVTTLIAKFLILDIPINRDSPVVVVWGFLRTIGGIVNTPEILFSTFDGFCHQTFRAARSDTMGTHDDEAESSRSKRLRQHETVEEVLLPQVHHEFLLWEGCNRDAKSRYNTRLDQLLPRHIYSHCVVNWDVLNRMGCDREIDDMLRIRLHLCHEFYSTYEFNEVCADDELQTKKIIKFRLGGRAHSLTLLEFARRLGLYQTVELEEEGFNVYFEGGLRSDEHFNAQDYWFSISREENLGLSRSHTSTIRNPILRVIHKMITYDLCQRTTGYGKVQKNDLWLLKIARKCKVLTEDVVRSLSALIYCRDLDTITLRDLIDSEGKLIPKDPQPGVPRVGIPRPPRASMQDLYDRMGRMDIRQEAIERMEYRQSYH
ncbi:retrotransposon ORF1 [Tanacetum coccineum]